MHRTFTYQQWLNTEIIYFLKNITLDRNSGVKIGKGQKGTPTIERKKMVKNVGPSEFQTGIHPCHR
jgi:hypothetical protein